MSRTASLLLVVAALCLAPDAGSVAHAQPFDRIPDYFFKEWTITKDCTAQHAGPRGHVEKGLKFRISRSSFSLDDQSYALDALDVNRQYWPGNWKNLRLEYRPGTKMTKVPADFECIPGEEMTSPFLAMAGNATLAEPWYEYEHWYGLIEIHGEPHHILIFPRDTDGPSSAVIVLQDVNANDSIKLNHDGTLHSES